MLVKGANMIKLYGKLKEMYGEYIDVDRNTFLNDFPTDGTKEYKIVRNVGFTLGDYKVLCELGVEEQTPIYNKVEDDVKKLKAVLNKGVQWNQLQ